MPRKQRRPAQPLTNQLRIIGGDWRGRKLDFPDLPGLRPTPDRIRETLFNWLQAATPGARCLDLFTGSGALGLEALSRGAASATLVDKAPAVIERIRTNLAQLDCDRGEAVLADGNRWLQATPTGAPYDLVFLDPPYGQGLLAPCCAQLEAGGWLSDGAWIYIEAERTLHPLPVPTHWRLHRQKQAGQVSSYLYIRGEEGVEL